jgi:hypothetical protein
MNKKSIFLIIRIVCYILIGAVIYFFFVPNDIITNFKCSNQGQSPQWEWPSIESPPPIKKGTRCCGGLKERAQKWAYDENCKIHPMGGNYGICLACGNGVCDTKYESKCNCPEDCK